MISGGTDTFEVVEGEYRIVAGAKGHGVTISDPIRVRASQKNGFRISLSAGRLLSGTVRGVNGQPLSDVTVGDLNAFIEAPLGRMSEMAADYFAPGWRTKSAADGTWSLLLPETGSSVIVAEVAGYAPAWRSDLTAAAESTDLVLDPGGALRLEFDRVAPDVVVTLTRKDERAAVPRAWQAQFWGRHIAAATLDWPALGAGEYDVYAQPRDARTLQDAVKLATVTIPTGGTREVRLQVPEFKRPGSVAIVLVRPGARFDPAELEAFGRATNGAPRSTRIAAEQVSGGTVLHLDTTALTPPYFATTSDRFLVLPLRTDGHVPLAAVLDLSGAALYLRPPGTLPRPVGGIAAFHGCQHAAVIEVPVAVAGNGNVSFPAPAGCTSLVLDFEPFSPIVISKQLASGDREWLGELTLHAAGSAAIRVATDDGVGIADAVVSIAAVTDGGLRASVPIATKTTDAAGWVRFDRLPAGRELTVEARTSEGDRSGIEAMRPDPTEQRVIDPLTVPQPATLIVEPKLDAEFRRQFPETRIQVLFVEPVERLAERQTVPAEGVDRVVFRRLLPGRWQLGAIVTAGQGSQPVFGEQVEVEPGETKEIEVLIKPLVFRGRVSGTIADLSGNIDILSTTRSDVVPSVSVSPSGEFVAILPRAGTYFVGVRPRSTGQVIWVGNTLFADPIQPVEITLPEGVIVARVRANGRPVAGASVIARMQYQPTTDVPLIAMPVKTGADGEARIEGLLPGSWVVSLVEDGYAQKSVMVQGSDPVYADLDVRSGLGITGRVIETFGVPVAGAKVTCVLPAVDGLPYTRLAFTNSDGSFDLGDRVASRSPILCSITSVVGAQGYRLVPGEEALLVLPANPATLRVKSLPAMERFSGLWLVSRDGRLIEVSPFVPRLPGDIDLTIPALAPEAWKLVRVSSPAEWMALITGGGTLPGIIDVTLTSGERKTVDLNKRTAAKP